MTDRLREYMDKEIIQFSIEHLLKCNLSEEPLWFGKDLRFDVQKQAAWRASDYEAYLITYPTKRSTRRWILTITNLLITGKRLRLFIEPNNEIQGLVIYPRDSVIVTVAKSLGVAAKVLRKTANQKDVIKKECLAYRLLPEFVPSVVEYRNAAQPESFDYVVSQFAANTHPVTHGEWSNFLPTVIDALLLCYERAGFKQINVIDVMDSAIETVEKHSEQSEFSELCRGVVQGIHDVCAQFQDDATLLTTFVHGDVTWDCIHRSGDSIKIIDWGNAGYRSVFYDLFIQEFYQANPKFWGNLLKVDSYDFFSDYFFGAFNSFYRGLTALTSVSFSLFDIKANLLVSLLENATDNFLRYRVVDELEGIEFFRHIKKIKDFLCAAY